MIRKHLFINVREDLLLSRTVSGEKLPEVDGEGDPVLA